MFFFFWVYVFLFFLSIFFEEVYFLFGSGFFESIGDNGWIFGGKGYILFVFVFFMFDMCLLSNDTNDCFGNSKYYKWLVYCLIFLSIIIIML